LYTRFVVDCKTHNLDPKKVLEFGRSVELPRVLEDGTTIQLLNLDITRNVPGAVVVKPSTKMGSIKMGAYLYPIKDNDHYVGEACHTWMDKGYGSKSHTRYSVDLYEWEGYEISQDVSGRDLKLYDKTRFHCETTTARGSTGNGLEHLFYSTHADIQEAILDPLVQTHGHGRLEIRCSPGFVPENMQEVVSDLREFYECTKHARVSMPVADVVSQYYPASNLCVLLRDKRIFKEDPPITPTMVRTLTPITGNTNSETYDGSTNDLETITHFISSTALPGLPVEVILVDWDSKGVYVVENWVEKPWKDIGTISPVYIRLGSRHGHNRQKVTAKMVALESTKYSPRTVPEQVPDRLISIPEKGSKQEPIQAVGARKKEQKKWFRAVQKIQEEILSPCLPANVKPKPFSKIGKTECIVEVIRVKNNYALVTSSRDCFWDNAAIRPNLKVGKCTKVLVRGKATGTYNNRPVFGNAVLKPLDPDTPKYGFLVWSADEFDKYAHLDLPG
jgi:hypothetical protein